MRVRKGTNTDPVKGRPSILEDRTFPSDNPWRESGLCWTTGGDWFDIPSGSLGRQQKVKEREIAICHACDVMEECLEYAMETKQPFGIWGGELPRERIKLRRRK